MRSRLLCSCMEKCGSSSLNANPRSPGWTVQRNCLKSCRVKRSRLLGRIHAVFNFAPAHPVACFFCSIPPANPCKRSFDYLEVCRNQSFLSFLILDPIQQPSAVTPIALWPNSKSSAFQDAKRTPARREMPSWCNGEPSG